MAGRWARLGAAGALVVAAQLVDVPEGAAASGCEARQRQAVGATSDRLRYVVDEVTSQHPIRGSALLRNRTRSAVARVHADCGAGRIAMDRYAREVRLAGRRPLDVHRLRQVLRALDRWGAAVGIQAASRPHRHGLRRCAHYTRTVHASFRLGTTPAAYGRDGWLDWRARNDGPRRVVVGQGGRAWATGVWPAYAGRADWDRRRRAFEMSFGGSSADPESILHPGEETVVRAALRIPYVPMRESGRMVAGDVRLYVYPGFGRADEGCAIPVPRVD